MQSYAIMRRAKSIFGFVALSVSCQKASLSWLVSLIQPESHMLLQGSLCFICHLGPRQLGYVGKKGP